MHGNIEIIWEYNGQHFTTSDLLYPDPLDPRHIPKHECFYIALSDRWSLDVLVDPCDYVLFGKAKWCQTYGSGVRYAGWERLIGKDKIYARRTVTRNGQRYTLFLHRLICEEAYGPPPSPDHVADHINGDTLDCRRSNLRWATLSQNAKNKFGSAWLQHRIVFPD